MILNIFADIWWCQCLTSHFGRTTYAGRDVCSRFLSRAGGFSDQHLHFNVFSPSIYDKHKNGEDNPAISISANISAGWPVRAQVANVAAVMKQCEFFFFYLMTEQTCFSISIRLMANGTICDNGNVRENITASDDILEMSGPTSRQSTTSDRAIGEIDSAVRGQVGPR